MNNFPPPPPPPAPKPIHMIGEATNKNGDDKILVSLSWLQNFALIVFILGISTTLVLFEILKLFGVCQ